MGRAAALRFGQSRAVLNARFFFFFPQTISSEKNRRTKKEDGKVLQHPLLLRREGAGWLTRPSRLEAFSASPSGRPQKRDLSAIRRGFLFFR